MTAFGRMRFEVIVKKGNEDIHVECLYEGDLITVDGMYIPHGAGSAVIGPERREVYRGPWCRGFPSDIVGGLSIERA